jgi:chromatin remodeling complex protein RSC6
MEKGYVYILSNPSFNFLKIGFTNRDVINRIEELNTTGVPTPFELVYEVLVWDAESVERKIHSELNDYRVRDNREFFQISQDGAYASVKSVLSKYKIEILYEKKHKDFRLKPSPKLGNVIGEEMMYRTEAYAKLWAYVKKRKLYEEENGTITCDIFLHTLTGRSSFSTLDVSSILEKNLS